MPWHLKPQTLERNNKVNFLSIKKPQEELSIKEDMRCTFPGFVYFLNPNKTF